MGATSLNPERVARNEVGPSFALTIVTLIAMIPRTPSNRIAQDSLIRVLLVGESESRPRLQRVPSMSSDPEIARPRCQISIGHPSSALTPPAGPKRDSRWSSGRTRGRWPEGEGEENQHTPHPGPLPQGGEGEVPPSSALTPPVGPKRDSRWSSGRTRGRWPEGEGEENQHAPHPGPLPQGGEGEETPSSALTPPVGPKRDSRWSSGRTRGRWPEGEGEENQHAPHPGPLPQGGEGEETPSSALTPPVGPKRDSRWSSGRTRGRWPEGEGEENQHAPHPGPLPQGGEGEETPSSALTPPVGPKRDSRWSSGRTRGRWPEGEGEENQHAPHPGPLPQGGEGEETPSSALTLPVGPKRDSRWSSGRTRGRWPEGEGEENQHAPHPGPLPQGGEGEETPSSALTLPVGPKRDSRWSSGRTRGRWPEGEGEENQHAPHHGPRPQGGEGEETPSSALTRPVGPKRDSRWSSGRTRGRWPEGEGEENQHAPHHGPRPQGGEGEETPSSALTRPVGPKRDSRWSSGRTRGRWPEGEEEENQHAPHPGPLPQGGEGEETPSSALTPPAGPKRDSRWSSGRTRGRWPEGEGEENQHAPHPGPLPQGGEGEETPSSALTPPVGPKR